MVANIEINLDEVKPFVEMIASAEQASDIIAGGQASEVNPLANFDPTLEYKPNTPGEPVLEVTPEMKLT